MLTMSQASAQLARKRYLEENVDGMSPVQLLVKVYDIALTSCARKDKEKLSRAIVELIAALNFEHRDVAVGLFRLYNYCLRQAKAERFDLVQPILRDLRDAWAQTEPSCAV